MTDREARPSTDEERDSLLRDPTESTSRSLGERVNTVAQEPLTPLTKTLLILALVLLLTSSIFIGLFAGAQHRLSLEHDGKTRTTVISATTTSTVTSAITSTFTSAITSTVTSAITSTVTSAITSTVTSTTIATITLIPPPVPTKVPEEIPCQDPYCVVLSASILSSLDSTQDPCENFYDFANGGWLDAHPLPADKSSFGNFEALGQENKQVIQKILESKSSVGSVDDEILLKLRDFYASCLDERGLDEIGIEPLLDVAETIRRLYKGTDIFSSHDNSDKVKGLTAAVAFLHSRGIDALFSFDIEGDVGVDPNHMVLWFNQPEFGLPSKEYFEEKSVRKAYQAVVERLLVTLADAEDNVTQQKRLLRRDSSVLVSNEDSDTWPPRPWPPWDGDEGEDDGGLGAHELAKKIVKFERKLAQASLDLDILHQDPIATYNPVPLSNLTETIPQIHFPTYFSTFTPRAYQDRVIVTYPAYSVSLSNILNETPSEVIEAYLVSRAALALSPYLGMSTEAWQAQRSLVELLTGVKKGAVGDRAEYCVGIVEANLGFATGRYFVNETFKDQAREKGTKVITDIVKAFKNSLKTIDWMDTESAEAAAEKADAIRVKVGYPISPNTKDPRSIASYYNSVKVVKDDFFGNILSSASSDCFKQWSKLNRPRDLDLWEMYPSAANAYFNPPSNEIVFPAGILQPPFFASSWPGYLSYGAFGQVASHELTHAFDSAGRLYNQQGKLAQWWTNSTSEGFKVKQDCIIKQYSSYAIDDGKGGKIHVNGDLTSGENIGDTGLIQAYRAWKAQYDTSLKDGHEYILPGLSYTRDQLFFISFARIWARAMKPAEAVQRIRTDPHSPSRFRVDGTVSNMPEFAEAFKCSKKAKLNPPNDDRCIFWS